jgi:hypothetical protein
MLAVYHKISLVERVVLRKGAWLPRSFTLNALERGFAA